jgi:signal transduction histidine kinase
VNALLEQRVAERTAAFLASEQKALAASRAKSAFLANMSHELRTPLNAVIGYAEILAEEATGRGQGELLPDLEKIRTAARHLLGLINHVLDLTKIEAGKMPVDVGELEVEELVKNVVTTARPVVEKNQNVFLVRVQPEIGRMRTDGVKVRQAVLNLLANAGKFTKDGEVRLSVESQDVKGVPGVLFRVADTGVGIPKRQQRRIFEPFVQADESTNLQYGGTGLGLALTRRFCKLLGGDVTVQSEPGKGAVFDIWLPRTAIPPRNTSGEFERVSARSG